MKTRVIKISNVNKGTTDIKTAANLLRSGAVVAFPTETVYGLGADAMNPEAVAKIFAAKERPADNPLIVHIADLRQLPKIVSSIPATAERLMNMFWPGPLSIVFPKNLSVPDITTAGLNTVVVRFPSHPIARALIKAASTPIAAPSANLSGKVSPTKAAHVLEDLNGKIPLIIDGGDIEFGLESTVVDCTVYPPVILRPGAVTYEVLRLVIPDIKIAEASDTTKSPGMKYRHYSPDTPVVLFIGEPAKTAEAIEKYVQKNSGKNCSLLWHQGDISSCANKFKLSSEVEKAATEIFHLLRSVDKKETDFILVQGYSPTGVGAAIMNRLFKAASEVIEVS